MRRRAFIATGLTATVAGCLTYSDDGDGSSNSSNGDGTSTDSNGDGAADGSDDPITTSLGVAPDESLTEDGLAPSPEEVEAPDVSVDELETSLTNDVEVPLLPIEDAYDWYRRRDARFVDARSVRAWEASHIAGAVASPAPTGRDSDDPTADWPEDERIVTYCGCPHHLSTSRAAGLALAGHEAVFAIDEGFVPWRENGYPIGSAEESATFGQTRTISGSVDPAYAGERVEVRHEPTRQREPAVIQSDGSFEVTIHFVDVDADTPLTVETPTWTRTAKTSSLTDGAVR